MNIQRTFDNLQKEKLGKYIYALRDPRDRKIFYVGQGVNDRIFDHFNEAELCASNLKPFNGLSSKVIRILDVWNNEEDVEWLILSHNLPCDSNVADYVESAIVDSLSESQNGETLNDVSPPNSSSLLPADLEAMAASFVNPDSPHQSVFIFPSQNALRGGANPYNATRTAWPVSEPYRMRIPSYAVGLENSISRGSFKISAWVQAPQEGKYEFTSDGHPNPPDYQPLLRKNWSNVLAMARGFWQRGRHLVVEFDGKGKFRIARGSQDKETWHNCV